MRSNQHSLISRLGAAGLAAAVLGLTGCALQATTDIASPVAVSGSALKGGVHGGQQPVSGASLQLYAASTSGYAAPALTLLKAPATSDANGNFTITNNYTCPSSASQVYLVATGGNPGNSNNAVNPNLALMAALGSCGNLTPATFVQINELTTVASAYALSPFMSSIANAGTSATNVVGLTSAFAAVNELVNIGAGTAPGTTPAGTTVPVAELNTLADILASCVNSTGGTASSSTASSCKSLFTSATPSGGTAPTDTIGAILNIARNPGSNVNALLALSTPTAPFQPTLTTAHDFTVSIKYTPSLSTPSSSAIDAAGNVWITNAASNTLTAVDSTGAPLAGSPFATGALSGPSGVAIDASGNAWVTSKTSSRLSVFTPAGAGSQTAVAGLNAPTGIAIDGNNLLWITNGGNNTLTAVKVAGTAPTSINTYTPAGVNTPAAVAINPF